MYGGNIAIQEEFFECFIEDDENKVLYDLGQRLRVIWDLFRNKEGERMYHLYKQVQINLFTYYKGKTKPESISPEELPAKAFEHDIDQKYKEYAENDTENQLFMLILSFLQSLCEGQFTNMQLFLNEQKWNGTLYPNSFGFVEFLRHAINDYHKVLNRYNLVIGNKVLELITELIKGEVYSNIAVLLHKTFIYDMCRIITDYNIRYHTIPRGFGLDPFEDGFRALKSRVIFVIKIMLENKDEKNKELLSQHLDTVGLMQTFANLMDNFLTKNHLHNKVAHANKFILLLSNADFKDTLGDALNIYIIYRYLWEDQIEFNNNMKDLINKTDKKSHDMLGRVIFTICKKLVNSIEIMVETKSQPLMKIWFPVIAVCYYLSDDTQKNFINSVDRSNAQTKISGLIDSAGEFIPQMYTEYKARKRIFGFNPRLLYRTCRLWTNAIGLTVTIINTFSYEISPNTGEEFRSRGSGNAERALNYTQIALAGLLVVLWILYYRTKHQSLMWERYVENNKKSIPFLPPTIKNKLDNGLYNELDENDCRFVMMLKGANSDEFKDIKQHAPEFAKIARKFFLLNSYFLVNSSTLIWHIIYLLIAVGSIFHPIIAIFQIFDIAIRSDTVKQISSAISKNSKQFIWTLFLLLVVNVIYSSIGFFFLNPQFKVDHFNLCTTAFSCFVNTVNLGLRSGGGIADAIGSIPYIPGKMGIFILRAIFDLSFFIIMIILLLNLIFGMIIDAFGDLRDQKTNNDEDQKNVCFICGIERSEFERYMSFEEHILEDHNLWSYIYYLVYLLDRQKTAKVEMTDIENLVLGKYLQKDSGWVPIGKSLVLEKIHSKEKEAH